jgi:hypothetical protein
MATIADAIRAHAHTTDERSDVWDEGENGKWAVLKPGLRCVFSDCHTCHEHTWKRLLEAVRSARPCDPDCPECFQKGGA